jgi:adhesin/invasin
LVSASNPATVGETLVLYLTGLGSVTPSVSDGAAGPLKPLSNVDASVTVELQDVKGNYYTSPNVSFAGLAPGYAGLYQVNFVVPSRVPSGQAYVNVGTDDAYTTETKIAIK